MGGVAARRLAVSVVLALMPVAAGALSGPVRAQTTRVAVGDNFYDPEPVFIAPGTTLVWTNQGREAHTVTSDEGSPEQFDSRTLAPGGSYSHTFNQSGVFTYHCVFHEDMLGTIVVG
ncbi:MAG: cupredoxin domain-containing protein, partial [Chloroflexi bacterium]|nr:cupredoxin domain-containing protein [Chloroflexota bacterium]